MKSTAINSQRKINGLLELNQLLAEFSCDRDWDQFHSPKNLSMALVAEAGELVEPFMWVTEVESFKLSRETLANVTDEIGDVFICLLNLSRKLDIDLIWAAKQKIKKNAKKYPIRASKGMAKKARSVKK